MKKLYKVKNIDKQSARFFDAWAGKILVLEPGQEVESFRPPPDEPPFEVEEVEEKTKKIKKEKPLYLEEKEEEGDE